MLNDTKRRPAARPVPHQRPRRMLALLSAVFIAAAALLGRIPDVRSDSGTWEREPYSACYLMFNTDASDDGEPDDGLMIAGHREFAKAVLEILGAWEADTGVALTTDEVWGPVREWLDLVTGERPVTPDRFPSTAENGFFAAFQRTWEEISGLELPLEEKAREARRRLEALVASAGDKDLYFDPVEGRNFYLRATTPFNESIPNKFRTSTGNYGYCLNWNYRFPKDQGADDIRDGEALKETLRITDGQYNKLVNILKLGYPMNTGLPEAFAGLPEEAMRCGTQAAVWIHLCAAGAAGNDGPGALTEENMQDVEDPLLDPSGVHDLSAYVRYLLHTADESEASVPGAELTGFEAGEPCFSDGSFTAELRIAAKNCSEYVRLYGEDLPEGAALVPLDPGTAVTAADDEFHLSGFEALSETVHTYRLTVPAAGNAGKSFGLTAAAVGKFTNTEMSIYWDENLIVDEMPTQIMSNIHVDEYPASAPIGVRLTLPYPGVLFLKADGIAAGLSPVGEAGETEEAMTAVKEEALAGRTGLPGAVLHLEDGEGRTAKTVSGEEIRFVSGKEGTLFNGVLPGTYVLVEDAAPEGYQRMKPLRITVAEDGGVQAFLFGNERTYGTLRLLKKDETDGAPLKDACFGLYYAQDVLDRNGETVHEAGTPALGRDGEPMEEFRTDETGEAALPSPVPIGLYDAEGFVSPIVYELRETQTPPGQYEAVSPVGIVFAYEDDETPLIERTLDLADPSPRTVLHKSAEKPTFVGRKEDAAMEEIAAVSAGEEVVYLLTLTNEGTACARNVLIKDVLPEDAVFLSQETDGASSAFLQAEDGRALYWTVGRLDAGETAVFRIRVQVSPALSGIEAVLVNTAYHHLPPDAGTVPDPEDPAIGWTPSEDVLYRTLVEPRYAFTAERLTEAPACPGLSAFGFFRGDTVFYRLTVENTGNTAIETDLCVEAEEIAEGVLEDLRFLSLAGGGAVWLNEEASAGTAVFPRIRLEAGKTAFVDFSCRIAPDSGEFTAPYGTDDPRDPYDGFRWNCRTSDVVGSYVVKIFDPLRPENGEETVFRADENGFPALKPQSAAVNTPVQLRCGYELLKLRVTEAPEARQDEGRYGFRTGTAVAYEAHVRNTGEVPLKLFVKDFFEDRAEGFFEDLRFTGVSGEGVTLLNEDGFAKGEDPHLLILPGADALLRLEATVAKQAEALTAPASADDKEDPEDGYVSTVRTYGVEAVYGGCSAGPEGPVPENFVRTAEERAELADRTDSVNTPVQVVVGQVKGETQERRPSDPVVLGIDDKKEKLLFAGLTVLSFAALVIAALPLFKNGKGRKARQDRAGRRSAGKKAGREEER